MASTSSEQTSSDPSDSSSLRPEASPSDSTSGIRLFCQCVILAKTLESLFLWWTWHASRPKFSQDENSSELFQWASLTPLGVTTIIFGACCLLVYLSRIQNTSLMFKFTGISFILITLFLEWCKQPFRLITPF